MREKEIGRPTVRQRPNDCDPEKRDRGIMEEENLLARFFLIDLSVHNPITLIHKEC